MRTSIAIGLGIACGVLGFAFGTRASAPQPIEKAAPTHTRAVPAPPVHALRFAPTHALRREGSETNCEPALTRARWCEAELDAARDDRRAVRQPWPEEAAVEAPEAWADAVEEALEDCALPAEVELVDCTEYPCTAALRPAEAPATPKAFEDQMRALTKGARACAPLRDAFRLDDDTIENGLDVFRLDAQCGEEREDFFVLMALDPAGPAFELLDKDRSDAEERDLNRWIYRRADDLSARWPCR